MNNAELAYELLSTPLFQGMTLNDTQAIVDEMRINVVEHSKGNVLAHADSPCQRLIIILQGQVQATTNAFDSSFSLAETLAAPLPLEPEHLFGRRLLYGSTYRAATPCTSISLSKKDFLYLYNNYDIFRLNLLNLFAAKLQRMAQTLWMPTAKTTCLRIMQFILHHCSYPAGEKHFKITMNTLAQALNTSRRDVSETLNSLEQEGLVVLSRGAVHIPAIEELYNKKK